MTPFDLEHIHDAEVAPLMEKIIAVCKKNGLPFVASFCVGWNEEEGGDFCTTVIPRGKEGWLPPLLGRMRIDATRNPEAFAFTITTSKVQP